MKQLKDYLHFYLGCECLLEDKVRVTLNGFENNHPVVLNKKDWQSARVNQMDLIKPILRPFPSDMTEDDEEETGLNKFYEYGHHTLAPLEFVYLLSQGFDLFGLIKAGLAIDKTKL